MINYSFKSKYINIKFPLQNHRVDWCIIATFDILCFIFLKYQHSYWSQTTVWVIFSPGRFTSRFSFAVCPVTCNVASILCRSTLHMVPCASTIPRAKSISFSRLWLALLGTLSQLPFCPRMHQATRVYKSSSSLTLTSLLRHPCREPLIICITWLTPSFNPLTVRPSWSDWFCCMYRPWVSISCFRSSMSSGLRPASSSFLKVWVEHWAWYRLFSFVMAPSTSSLEKPKIRKVDFWLVEAVGRLLISALTDEWDCCCCCTWGNWGTDTAR